eukprot:TRINITY_DN50878_c0_g1_i1.p1 TRINITY_DN50878_c0_g1~~TRINITY_DN50878_c0_g1_i1.p1  ORF type:complete len:219 (-),score=58.38 TRINITY_DN50878_c0_g1_i1:52-708(-)
MGPMDVDCLQEQLRVALAAEGELLDENLELRTLLGQARVKVLSHHRGGPVGECAQLSDREPPEDLRQQLAAKNTECEALRAELRRATRRCSELEAELGGTQREAADQASETRQQLKEAMVGLQGASVEVEALRVLGDPTSPSGRRGTEWRGRICRASGEAAGSLDKTTWLDDHISTSPRATSIPTKVNTTSVSYTHLRAHETPEHLVCRLLLEKKKKK